MLQGRPAGARFRAALSWMIVSYMIATFGLLMVNAMAARLLGADGFAFFVLTMTGTALASQVGLFGLQGLAVRDSVELRDGVSDSERDVHVACVRTASRVLLPLAGVVCAGVLTGLAGVTGRTTVILIVSVAGLTWVGGQQRLFAKYLRGFGDVVWSSLLEGRAGGALMLAPQGLTLAVLFVAGIEVSAGGAILAASLAAVPASLLARARFTSLMGRTRSRWRPVADLRFAMRRSRGFSGLQVGMNLDTLVDLFVAATLLHAVASSSFAAGHRLATLLVVPSALIAMVISPLLARSRADRATLDGLVRAGATGAVLCSLVLAIPLIATPDFVSAVLFGEAFPVDSTVLRVLVVGAVLRAATNLGSVMLAMTGHEGAASRIWWVGVGLRLLACLAASLTGSAIVIALASLGVTIVVQVMLSITSRRLVGVDAMPTIRPRVRLLLRADV